MSRKYFIRALIGLFGVNLLPSLPSDELLDDEIIFNKDRIIYNLKPESAIEIILMRPQKLLLFKSNNNGME